MKKALIILLILFICLTLSVKFLPLVTTLDWSVIMIVQHFLQNIPIWIPEFPDCVMYSLMITLAIISGTIYFFRKKLFKQIVFLWSVPLVTFLLNCIIKPLVHRVRPPFELQLSVHPHSLSYVSSHSLVTMCLWGMVIYFVYKNCTNNYIKNSIIALSSFWILFVGFSRVWLGVHHPTDVLGAYILGLILVILYIKGFEKL